MTWLLYGICLAFIIYIWWMHRNKDGPFDFQDLFLDHSNDRASLPKVMLMWLLVLASWVVIVKTLGIYKAEGVESLLLGLVTAFVGQITVLAAIDRWKAPPPPEPPKPPEMPQ